MEFLVGVLIVALLLGPVLWLRPSPMDRRRARIRDRARELGLHIRVCDLPQTRRERVRGDHPGLGAAYSLRSGEKALPAGCWIRSVGDDWQTVEGDPVPGAQRVWLEGVAAGLPAGVVALERGGRLATVYWDERGGEAAVDAVLASLQRLSELAVRGPADRDPGYPGR